MIEYLLLKREEFHQREEEIDHIVVRVPLTDPQLNRNGLMIGSLMLVQKGIEHLLFQFIHSI